MPHLWFLVCRRAIRVTFLSFLFMEGSSPWRPRVKERTGRPLPIRTNSNRGREGDISICVPSFGRVGGPHVDKGADGYEGGDLFCRKLRKFLGFASPSPPLTRVSMNLMTYGLSWADKRADLAN